MTKLKLTESKIKQLLPENDFGTEFYDTSFTAGCFGIKVYWSGRKVFFLRFTSHRGIARRITLGCFKVVSLKDARKQALLYLGEIQKEIDPTEKSFARGRQIKITELAAEFLKNYVKPNLATSTEKNYQGVFRRVIIPNLGSYYVSELTPGHINPFLSSIRQNKGDFRAAHMLLSSMYRYALVQGLIEYSPCHGGQLIKYPRDARSRVLSDQEIIDFWESCHHLRNIYHQLFFKILLLTGMRANELHHVKRADLSHGTIRVAPETAKTKREQIVPLPKPVFDMAESLPVRDDGYLFQPLCINGRGRSYYFRCIREQMGQESADIQMHDLRRTLATNLERLGMVNDTIAAVLGHNKATRHGGVTYSYTYYTFRTEKLHALTLWHKRVTGLVTGKEEPLPLYASLQEQWR